MHVIYIISVQITRATLKIQCQGEPEDKESVQLETWKWQEERVRWINIYAAGKQTSGCFKHWIGTKAWKKTQAYFSLQITLTKHMRESRLAFSVFQVVRTLAALRHPFSIVSVPPLWLRTSPDWLSSKRPPFKWTHLTLIWPCDAFCEELHEKVFLEVK